MQPQVACTEQFILSLSKGSEVAGVLNAHWPEVQQKGKFNTWQLRTLDAVRRCRSAALGAHVDGCTSCGHLRISYNPARAGSQPALS